MVKREKLDAALAKFYEQGPVSNRLQEAILYSIHAGGKRIRPLILLETLEGFGITLKESHYQVAAALEMVHTGSLIHDDLPAMDDDDYRRGRLTNHKQFDEATAILAGDSLFLDPYGLITQTDLKSETIVALIAELSQAAGTFGMVGGQMLDIEGEEQALTLEQVYAIHSHKTGKLLAFPFKAAGIIAEQDSDILAKLEKVGLLVGTSFQVRDDILDLTASFADLGKTPQKDLTAQKATYPSLLGLDESYRILNDSLDRAEVIFQKLKADKGFIPDKILEILERLRLYA
ncbi:dimethylallyltransferase [Streptococcus criceti]|uniref:Farnesyl diphosphate synthase n=1 Tax=Streptococcus criceti HS-6 TaxID=873449 RepID=G5JRL1_STRCG|nr:farnesyl diphosphate synthase [Streptococcus criceti]EHI73985.1 geranyltranstransferase [Streptococcus criceti HS-6]SUN42896.1 dimethylallyltransferase [Streptococcus criceti]